MARINQKLDTMHNALISLDESIALFNRYEKLKEESSTKENEQLFLAMRDSMIQRFEYCTDLFWKLLKVYLEDVEKVTLPVFSPRGVIREAATVKIMSETEADACMEMIKNRNQTSHIYHEEVAESIAQKVSSFYKLMKQLVVSMQSKIV